MKSRFAAGTLIAVSVLLSTADLARGQASVDLLPSELLLTPESLIVAGLAPAGVDGVFAGLLAEEELLAQLEAKRAESDEAVLAVSLAAEAVLNGVGGEAAVATHAQASSALAQLKGEIQNIQVDLREAALEGMAPQAIAQLELWPQSNHFNVPPEFRVLALSQNEWQEVAVALRAEQRFLRLDAEYGADLSADEALSEEHAALLDGIRENQIVVAAAASLATQLDAMSAAFDQVE